MGLSVILVDDHTMLRQGIRRALESEGIKVVAEASDGAAAIRLALEHKPDVVLMDVSMPGMDGVEAARRLVEADARQRVVMLTMHIDRDVIDRAIRAGAVGYLTKRRFRKHSRPLFEHMLDYGWSPIVDLVHHTSYPAWLKGGFADPR